MDEFTMSAFALLPDGRTGDAFAEVASPALVDCFVQMAGEVADWLPVALAEGDGEPPRAIELTLEWSGAPATEPAPGRPPLPGGPTRRRPSPPPGALCCVARRHLGRTRVVLAGGAGPVGARG
ncbi:MAG: hypothetical protein JST59_29630 [Actinobacteria bacterium]|nr:hypothetical protein [Actinomycetota bacterium]